MSRSDDEDVDVTTAVLNHPGVKMGLNGLIMVTAGMFWVMLNPTPTIFGVGEGLTTVGGIMVLLAIYRAAFASMDQEDVR